MYAIILTTLTVLYGLLTWHEERAGLFLIAALLPTYLLRFSLGPIPMTFLEVMILLFISIWVWRNKKEWRTALIIPKRYKIGIILLVLAATIAIFTSPDTFAALGVWKAYFIEPIALALVARAVLTKKKENPACSPLLQGFGCGALVVSLLGIAQYFTQIGIPAPWDIELRITSVFDYPNALGLYLGPIIILGSFLLYQSIKKKEIWQIAFWGSTTTLSFLTITLAESEAAIIAVLTTLFFASLFEKKLRLITLPLAALSLILVATLFINGLSSSPELQNPLISKLTLQDYSGQVRVSQWVETWEMVKDYPVTGVGLAGYPTVFEGYHKATHLEIFQYPHTNLLNIWSELGVLGLIAAGWLVVVIAIDAVKTLTLHKEQAWLTLATLAVFVEMDIHGLVDVPYFKNDLAILTWLIIALFLSSLSYARHSTPQEKR
jgi:putative inorganic carbon (hco3(-)) transporter